MKYTFVTRCAVFYRPFFLLAVLALLACPALAQGWQQAVRLPAGADSNDGYSEGQRTATDAAGNVYVVGGFYGTVSFGATTLTSTGPDQERDFFVAKLSPDGQWLWAVQGGGAGRDQANDIALDAAGNPYITGGIGLSATLGPFTLTASTGGAGNDNMFVARLTPTGQFVWATKGGGRTGQSLALDAAGNVLVAGTYSNGSATIGSTTLANYGSVDIFVAKLDPTGTAWLWAARAGGTGNDYATQIATDAAGNAYITGDYSTNVSVQFGPFTLINANGYVAKLSPAGQFVYATKMAGGNNMLSNGLVVDAAGNAFVTGNFRGLSLTLGTIVLANANSNSDGFLARIGPTGTWQWGIRFGGTLDESGRGIALDGQGNLYATGSFTGTNVAFGSTTLSATGIIGEEIYVARLNAANGQWVWVAAAGGIEDDEGMGLSTSATGAVTLIGTFSSPNAPFGSTTLYGTAYIYPDTFVAQVNGATGAWNWAVSTEGGGDRRVLGTCTDGQGNVYVTGTFVGTVAFGATTLTAEPNGNDIFVAKLDAAGQWVWAARAGGGATDRGMAVAADAAGNVYVTGTFAAGSFAAAVPAFTATFGSSTITTNGATDAFIAKLDPAGQWVWAVAGGGTGSDAGNGIGVNAAGDPFVTGTYAGGRPVFGPTTLPTSPTQGGTFVAHLSTAGQWRWTVRAGSSGSDTGRALAVDAAGNPVITGEFNGTGAFGGTSLVSAGGSDIYVAKLNGPTGTFAWATRAGGTGSDQGDALALDAAGNPVLTGIMGRTAMFGTTALTGSTYANVFVAKLTAAGQFTWAVAGPCTDIAEGAALALDAGGAVYVAGQFQGVLTLGASTLTNPLNPNPGFPSYRDLFVARLSAGGTWQQAVQATGGGGGEYATGVAVGAQLYVAGYSYSRSLSFGASTITSYNTHPTGFLAQPAGLVTATRAGASGPRWTAQLFPNPAAGATPIVSLVGMRSSEPVEITISDALGRTLLCRELPAGEGNVSLPEVRTWPAGIYLVTVQHGAARQVLRLVRE